MARTQLSLTRSRVLTPSLTQWLKESLLKTMSILETAWSFLVVKYSKRQTHGIFIASCCHTTRPFALWDLGNRDKQERTEMGEGTDSSPSLM